VESDEKEQGYVELPYYLVIQGMKAGIGDMSSYVFKYESGKITACTLKPYMDETLDFSETKTEITKEYLKSPTEKL